MRKNYFITLFFLIIITSCNNDVQRIIKHRDEIVALSLNKEIINDEHRNFYVLITYNLDKKMQNEYFFNKKEKKISYILHRDSIQFNPDSIINISKDDVNYQTELCSYYLKISQVLKSHSIKSLSGEIYKNSPKLTIHMDGGKILIYYPNKKALDDNNFINFKKVGDGWYLLKQ